MRHHFGDVKLCHLSELYEQLNTCPFTLNLVTSSLFLTFYVKQELPNAK